MGDFGKILDEWEMHSRKPAVHKKLSEQIDKYPVYDKDADRDSTSEPLEAPERVHIEDTIDLHGLTVSEAITATDTFLRTSVSRGLRKVLVIHGKGRNGDGVLRREIRNHLETHSLAGAMGHPKGDLGGRGALWVMLRYRSR